MPDDLWIPAVWLCTDPNSHYYGASFKVTRIENNGKGGFYGCEGLRTIHIPGSINYIEAQSFTGSSDYRYFTQAYFGNTSGWKMGTTAISATDLSNPATAANYLKQPSYGSDKIWTRSDT